MQHNEKILLVYYMSLCYDFVKSQVDARQTKI